MFRTFADGKSERSQDEFYQDSYTNNDKSLETENDSEFIVR